MSIQKGKELEGEPSGSAIVVDDDHSIVELLSDFLQINGIKILGKGFDGKKAVELYEKLLPDFTFIDAMMPVYDGFYAFERIKDINPDAKVIMITADLTADTAKKLERLKIPYIYKPHEFDDIIILIKKLSQG